VRCSELLFSASPNTRQQFLNSLLTATDVSRVYLFLNEMNAAGELCMSQTAEACAEGVPRELDNPELQQLPYAAGFERWMQALSRGAAVAGVVSRFPEAERSVLQAQGILSILVIPLFVGTEWRGFFGFDDVKKEREWREEDMRLLETAARLYGSYLHREELSEELAMSAALNHHIIEESPDAIVLSNRDLRIVTWNRAAEQLTGIPSDHALGAMYDTLAEELTLRPRIEIARLERLLTRGHAAFDVSAPASEPFSIVNRNGEARELEGTLFGLLLEGEEHVGAVFRDVTVRRQMEREIDRSLREKERLLREVHHRVKNNLAILMAILNLEQNRGHRDSEAALFENLRSRILSIELVHEKLYRGSDLGSVFFPEYVESLVSHVVRAAKPDRGGEVAITFEIAPIHFDADRIVSLGLIVAELTMNALKHAFRDTDRGRLRIALQDCEGTYVLSVSDNGPGFDEAAEQTRGVSLGIQLVEALAGQLKGTVSRHNEDGAVFRIEFPASA
jgi:PAS domain S-box-containing protein